MANLDCGAAAASFGFLSSSEWFWGCREASKSGLSSSEWFWGCREASKWSIFFWCWSCDSKFDQDTGACFWFDMAGPTALRLLRSLDST